MATWVLILTGVVFLVFFGAGVWLWRHSPPVSRERSDVSLSQKYRDWIW